MIGLVVILLRYFVSCNTNKNEISLQELGIKADIDISHNGQKMNVDVLFAENYFVNKETNEVINMLLMEKIKKNERSQIDTLYISHRYIDLTGISRYTYTPKKINNSYELFSGNQNLRKATIYAFNEYTSDEIINMDLIIQDTREIAPNEYTVKGGFWSLLFDYFKDCPQDKKSHSSMRLFYKGLEYFEEKKLSSPQKIQAILNLCTEVNSQD